MAQVLNHLVLLSTPPQIEGFELGGWATARYLPALTMGPLLQLRAEWNNLDQHQKTLLSDDFGMAVPTHLLMSALNLRSIAPTNYLLKHLNGLGHTLGGSVPKIGVTVHQLRR
jgi:hypothetical protein